MEERRGRLPALNALRAFEASARHLNFRLAAEELGLEHAVEPAEGTLNRRTLP